MYQYTHYRKGFVYNRYEDKSDITIFPESPQNGDSLRVFNTEAVENSTLWYFYKDDRWEGGFDPMQALDFSIQRNLSLSE